MSSPDEKTDVSTHYRFGENWSHFAGGLTMNQRLSAKQDLARFVGEGRIRNASFLDIGSGSGVHSLAALELGASAVLAVDFDPQSVATTRKVLDTYQPNRSWRAERANVLTDFADSVDRYDIVYSWGVLHHTGSMWDALGQARRLVKPGGHLAVALYNKTPLCRLWAIEKRVFSKLPRAVQAVLASSFVCLLAVRKVLLLENPVSWFRNYSSMRGMSPYFDAHDWLGGYPYESVGHDELVQWMKARGGDLVYSHKTQGGIGLFGTPCGEYLFRVG